VARSRRVSAAAGGEPQSGNFVDPQTKAVIDMPGQYDKRRLKLDLMVACSLFAAGVVVSGMSLAQIRAETRMQTAQATQPLQRTPSDDQNKPAEAKPGGDRPTTPAPEPARPDPQTQGAAAAAKPALPPAPAEKIAPPIREK
jgi:hypothetical protein